ncbi:uroporphyrinogen-III synthase [Botrytis cinerea]
MRLAHPHAELGATLGAHLVLGHVGLEILGAGPAGVELGEEIHEGRYVGAVAGGGGAGTKSVPNDGYEERFEEVSFNAVRYGGGVEGSERGFEPTFVPVLEHRFVDEGVDEVKRLLKERGIGREEGKEYGGLIFTSQRAVELFAKLVEEGRSEDDSDEWPYLQNIPIYTVGPATSRALRSIPQTPALNIFGAESGNGEALAHYMLEHYGNWYKNRCVKPSLLFMVGEQRRDIIPRTLMDPELSDGKRIQVDELVVYGTGVMESFEEDFKALLKETEHRDTRWVVVFHRQDAMLCYDH